MLSIDEMGPWTVLAQLSGHLANEQWGLNWMCLPYTERKFLIFDHDELTPFKGLGRQHCAECPNVEQCPRAYTSLTSCLDTCYSWDHFWTGFQAFVSIYIPQHFLDLPNTNFISVCTDKICVVSYKVPFMFVALLHQVQWLWFICKQWSASCSNTRCIINQLPS